MRNYHLFTGNRDGSSSTDGASALYRGSFSDLDQALIAWKIAKELGQWASIFETDADGSLLILDKGIIDE